MLSTLILYLTQKFETFTYLQKVYGLGLEREVNDSKFISVIEGNTEQHLNLDTHLSCSVFLKNGNKSVEQVESPTVANEYLVKHTYPFKCLVYAKIAESANCESESQKIADSIEKSITGRQKAILASTQLDNAYIEIKNTNYEKHSIYSGYYTGGGLGDNDILIEIEFDFIVEGNQNCFVDSPCDNDDFVFDFDAPQTFCERVDACLDIPTEDGQYVLDITDGVKSWTEYSPSGAVVISKTQAQFLALVSTSDLVFPTTYKITDIQNGLFINTLSANTFRNEASLSFLAPDYTLHAQYHYTDGALANNAIVTWGGFYWQNTSGGSATPDLPNEGTISTSGFTKIAKSVANGYVPIILEVTIQVAQGNIYIVSAKDDKDNYIEQSIAAQIVLPFLPLEVNQWNNLTILGNKVLVCNNVVYFNNPMDLSSINNNSGTFSFTSEVPFLISRISQNKLTGQGSTIRGNITHTCSIIYRNTLSGPNSINTNYLTSLAEIQGNILSGGLYNNTYPTILAMALDDRAKCNDNVLSGDGVAIWDCHGHEATEINGNTLSGNGAKITHIIQKFLDECNDNTLSGQDTRIEVCNQDYGTKINGHTLAQTGEYIKQLKLTECELTNGTTAIHRLDVSGKDIDLTGFTQPIYDEDISANVGTFAIEHDFTSSPLNSGSSVLYNIIPLGYSIVSLTASGALTGTTIEIGLETDAEGLINEVVGLLPLTWNGVSAAATANRSLKIKATGGNITAGTLTVKVEFTI